LGTAWCQIRLILSHQEKEVAIKTQKSFCLISLDPKQNSRITSGFAWEKSEKSPGPEQWNKYSFAFF